MGECHVGRALASCPGIVLPVPVSTELDRGDDRLGAVVAPSATEAKNTTFFRWQCGLRAVGVRLLLFSKDCYHIRYR